MVAAVQLPDLLVESGDRTEDGTCGATCGMGRAATGGGATPHSVSQATSCAEEWT